jgi:exonuclease VII small subunit
MPATHTYYSNYPQTSYPIQVPQKPGYYYPPQQNYGRVSASPPEAPDSVTTSGVASYEPSAASSNYAGSASDYESTNGATSVDLLDYMGNRLNGSFDPMPLDRSLAKQAQTSGELNAKHRELLELQQLAQRRLMGAQASFAEGMRAAKDVQKDLQWTQKRVDALNDRAARKYPEQFRSAQHRYPAPVDY